MSGHVLTPAMRRALAFLAEAERAAEAGEPDAEPAELACEGLACWAGNDRISRRTVQALLRYVLVSAAHEDGDVERYVINGTGRAALENPGILSDIAEAMAGGGSWTTEGNRMVRI